jgi:hypothetical protein
MMRGGNGDNGELTMLDLLSVLSFALGLANYGENLTQSDKQELMQQMSDKIDSSLRDIHDHLSVQDAKINLILRMLEDKQ